MIGTRLLIMMHLYFVPHFFSVLSVPEVFTCDLEMIPGFCMIE